MAIAAYFEPKGMTYEQYRDIHRKLDAAGHGLREQHGRLHHSCFGEDGSLMVYDVWESPEAFEAFGKVLGPIMAESGVDAGEPMVMPIRFMDQVELEGEFPD